ncbi:hypothetical protein SAMN04490207_6221 [Pseudomonas gessardii]|uniref:hypothetical protein n=1 Tax=Pseudomonas gessardii TaxID=78544 RepID=UPI00088100C2|nr:hypothetical protein [Pseudomonas gessardii]MRU53215.1 hypothetical protein [Pseudomonas gessardii]ONH38762.1 hypothetical protein BLL38_22665 [Pseudomonas gessardii]SDR41379.1 hypothetical protein SAMN04490207_6221 [Pseudomonas gessardii]
MQTMKVRLGAVVVDREVAHMTRRTGEDGVEIEYPEPLLNPGEVVYGRDADNVLIIATSNPG